MDAVEFLKARKEMCKRSFDKDRECALCDAYEEDTDYCLVDTEIFDSNSVNDYKQAVSIVEQWIKDNPPKSRMQDFLEKFPNAKINDHGFPKDTCCMCVGYCSSCENAYPDENDCYFCWKKPVED